MQSIFGVMMIEGYLEKQVQMAMVLKAIHYLLRTQENLSEHECDDCLLYFFREYAQGCAQPISDTYIKSKMIPVIKGFNDMNLFKGISLLQAAKIKNGIK